MARTSGTNQQILSTHWHCFSLWLLCMPIYELDRDLHFFGIPVDRLRQQGHDQMLHHPQERGLVIAHHDKVKDELGFLATLATSPRNAVCDKPFIFPGHAANVESYCEFNSCPNFYSPNTNNEGDQGDLLL
jgi:hypothetical protein